jgi:hypothetical protein
VPLRSGITWYTVQLLLVFGRVAWMRKSTWPRFTTVVEKMIECVPSPGFVAVSPRICVIARSGSRVPAGGPVGVHAAARHAAITTTAPNNFLERTPAPQSMLIGRREC